MLDFGKSCGSNVIRPLAEFEHERGSECEIIPARRLGLVPDSQSPSVTMSAAEAQPECQAVRRLTMRVQSHIRSLESSASKVRQH